MNFLEKLQKWFFQWELNRFIRRKNKYFDEALFFSNKAFTRLDKLEKKYPGLFTPDVFLGHKTFDEAFTELEIFISLRNRGFSTQTIMALLHEGKTLSDIYNLSL